MFEPWFPPVGRCDKTDHARQFRAIEAGPTFPDVDGLEWDALHSWNAQERYVEKSHNEAAKLSPQWERSTYQQRPVRSRY